MGNEAELTTLFRDAHLLGQRMLELLASAVTDGVLDDVDALLARRTELLARTAELIAQGAGTAESVAAAQELAVQQRALESQVRRAMQVVQHALEGRQLTRENMAGVSRILNNKGHSRILNQRR
ncbi:MAG TPA: hypothetical protein VD969_17090 [Symbiobacteriaceae bacterium]|nr:hypothetical protein [Symbiobacteriaceae bacterium]